MSSHTPLPHLSALEFSGADARDFLHRQLSADIAALAPGEARFACLCLPNGRVLALVLALAAEESTHLVCARSLAGLVAERLRRFVLRDRVTIAASGRGVAGLEQAPGGPLPGLAYALRGEPANPQSELADWRLRELEAGVAWLEPATSDAFLPQMLGFVELGAVSFRKGCFPGQEIIARTRYLGRLKQRALVVETRDAFRPEIMEQVTALGANGEIETRVIDRASADGRTVALLVARSPEPTAVTALCWREREIDVTARWRAAGESQASATR